MPSPLLELTLSHSDSRPEERAPDPLLETPDLILEMPEVRDSNGGINPDPSLS